MKNSSLIEFAGLIIFFAVYKLAPSDQSTRYASLALLVVLAIQFWWYRRNKVKMPTHVWSLNLLALVFLIPSIIFNSFEFIRIKLMVVKAIVFLVPLGMLLFGKNCLKVLFGSLPGFETFSVQEFDRLNLWMIVAQGLGLAVSTYAFFHLDDDAFLLFKTIWIPIVSSLWIIPMFVSVFRHELKKQKEQSVLKKLDQEKLAQAKLDQSSHQD